MFPLLFALVVGAMAMEVSAQGKYASSPADKIEKWKQAVVESSRVLDEKFSLPLPKKDFEQYDYSQLWVTNYPLGYIGNNYQRMVMSFERIKKLSATEYSVDGYSKVMGNVGKFAGVFRVIEARKFKEIDYGIEDYLKGSVKKQGYVIAEFIINEDARQKKSGVFRGVLITGWYINMEDKMILGDLCSGDCGNNNQFYGEWTSYKGGSPKAVAWGLYRIPMSSCLDVGAGEFFPAEKYLDNGWREYCVEQKQRDAELNRLYGR